MTILKSRSRDKRRKRQKFVNLPLGIELEKLSKKGLLKFVKQENLSNVNAVLLTH